ncbi:N-acetylglucosamine-binding protein GbpA [Pseudomonas sp. Teo4]|uniref:N-acetylglucosamine-binding protein GbpA n=1 Tax=Pseudomonas sp. Teo4 TaxID=3064528 RepID=UPI002ABACDF0|nr:N-acetylglucosamine-binding protein GbpA [Pseudomonas sp. Teo4]MDZ3994226.1 GlcNAc-binding protein A [Pseudomonas sp. Teo4]
MQIRTFRRGPILASSALAVIASAGLMPQLANAHGYVSEPPSRAYACRIGLNDSCGAAEYEPQSVGEAPKGFPALGPADGKLASGGVVAGFAALDEQSSTRWHKSVIDKRDIEFDWYYMIGHKTTGWEYFITRSDWNPNAPLSRAAFESTPFCKFDGKGEPPRGDYQAGPAPEKHRCTLPQDRSGHHAILAVWTIADTVNSFYNVIDVDIQAEGGPAPEWRQISSINPHRDLQVGDKVKARAFVDNVESEQYSVSIDIDNAEEGIGPNWSHKLARQINQSQSLIKAGQRDAEGNIEPVQGANIIFAKAESGVTNYQLHFDAAPIDDPFLHLHGLKPEYTLQEGKGSVDFSVMTNRKLQVSSTLFNSANQQVGFVRQQVDAGTAAVTLPVASATGQHLLKVVGVDKAGRVLLQEEREVQLKAAGDSGHDYVYPQSINNYKAGTRVLQPKTGEVFECKPFPAEGWCGIYSQSANHYEPGTGSNWQDAWIKR